MRNFAALFFIIYFFSGKMVDILVLVWNNSIGAKNIDREKKKNHISFFIYMYIYIYAKMMMLVRCRY